MANQRSAQEKAADAVAAFSLLRDEVTPPVMREVMAKMDQMQAEVAALPDGGQKYLDLVQTSLSLRRVIAANDRAVMLAAAILTSSGVSRPVIDITEE